MKLRVAWLRSLRGRLLLATFAAVLVALLLAGWVLSGLFSEHVLRQFAATLTAELDQVTARFELDAQGRPVLDPARLSDPRWTRPYSGRYWQVDEIGPAASRRGVLRSRSLWDAELQAPVDTLADGEVHVHKVAGPAGAALLMVERTVRVGRQGAPAWRLLVAADRRETAEAIGRFNGVLAASLAALLGLLMLAAAAQVRVGLAPLQALQRGLTAVREGREQRLQGQFPREVQPLVDGFNGVLERNAQVVARARTQAGNLAHAIKTPLAALAQAAEAAHQRPQALHELPALVAEQVELARRHVNWHLARSRAAASLGVPGVRADVQTVVAGLVRVMSRVHAERGLRIDTSAVTPGLAFAGEAQDLQEMLGNLLDNACKWARADVRVTAQRLPGPGAARLLVVVEDDGLGIAAAQREQALARGARLDESTPGSGLGLAIVRELAGLYGGQVSLDRSERGGLRVELRLPDAPAAARSAREPT